MSTFAALASALAIWLAFVGFMCWLLGRAPDRPELDLDEIFDRDLPTATPFEPPARNIFRGSADPYDETDRLSAATDLERL